MTKRSKTPQAEPEIHAQAADDQEPGIEARRNPAGLTMAADAPIPDGEEAHHVSGTTFLAEHPIGARDRRGRAARLLVNGFVS